LLKALPKPLTITMTKAIAKSQELIKRNGKRFEKRKKPKVYIWVECKIYKNPSWLRYQLGRKEKLMIQAFNEKAEITTNEEEVVFLTPKDVSEMMNCSLVSARQLFHRKDFPSIRIGKNFKVMKSAFIKWCEQKHE
jgi:hypothetical protein